MTWKVRALQPNLWFKLDGANASSGAKPFNSGYGGYTGRPYFFAGDTFTPREPGVAPNSVYSILYDEAAFYDLDEQNAAYVYPASDPIYFWQTITNIDLEVGAA